MTKIQITPKWSEVKPEGYYVYLHRRSSEGSVFYVGKGKGKRAWDLARTYNSYWHRSAVKHGVSVEICQDNMTEDGAFLLEMWLIAKLKINGERLSNMSDGGEGVSGRPSPTRRAVHCSNGMFFDYLTSAEDWLRDNGFPKASATNIANCCNGVVASAYGFTWSFDGDCGEYVNPRDRMIETVSRSVYCSNGLKFQSIKDAERWLRSSGFPRAVEGNIRSSCIGTRNSAYGHTWSFDRACIGYIDPEVRRLEAVSKKVVRSDGVVFQSMAEAAKSVNGKPQGVSRVCRGKKKTHRGFGWAYELVDGEATP